MYRILIVLLLAILLPTTLPAQERKDSAHTVYSAKVSDFKTAFERVVGNKCGDPCLMPKDHGMNFGLAIAAALALKRGDVAPRQIVINGDCIGECVVFAGKARAFICVGPEARFYLYRIAHHNNYKDPPMPSDVNEWVRVQTGVSESAVHAQTSYPLARSLKDALMLNAKLATLFWKPCSPEMLVAAR